MTHLTKSNNDWPVGFDNTQNVTIDDVRLRRWTLNKFLTHDAIAQGAFNRETCTATSCMTAWQAQLLNTLEVVELLCNRMDSDFSSTGLKFRKPYTFNQVESSLHLYSSDSYRLKSCISMTCEPVAW